MPLVRAASRQSGEPAPTAIRDRDALAEALHGGSPAERREAARGLAASPQSAGALCARLGAEPDASVRTAILTSLIRQRSPAAVAGLLPCLRSDDAALRNAAIEALQAMPEALEPHVDSLLADPDSDVRIFAVNVLAALPHAGVPGWLEGVVRTDCHVNVCAAAADALAGAGDECSVPALAALPARFPCDPFVAFAAAAAIRRIRGL